MKKLLAASAAILTLAVTAPAFATSLDATETFEINAENPAKCLINAFDTTVTLDADSLSTSDGFARSDIGQSVAAKLSELEVHAWCTGTKNKVNLTRTALAIDTGAQTSGGFNTAVIYDLAMNIPDAIRSDANPVLEDSVDGIGGAWDGVSAFGPTGDGSLVTFTTAGAASTATIGRSNGNLNRTDYSDTQTNRLLAGEYTGEVTITITPGV